MFEILDYNLAHTAADRIADIILELDPLKIVTPVNYQTEKQKWINAVSQNGVFLGPDFIYDYCYLYTVISLGFDLHNAEEQLKRSIRPRNKVDTIVLDMIDHRIQNAYQIIDLAYSIVDKNDELAAKCVAEINPGHNNLYDALMATKPFRNLAATPRRIDDKKRKQLSSIHFNAERAKHIVEQAISAYNIKCEVKVDEATTKVGMHYRTGDHPAFFIPANYEVTGFELVKLISREVECRLRSYENSKWLLRGLLGYQSPLLPLVPILAKSEDEMLFRGYAKISDESFSGRYSSQNSQTSYRVAQSLAMKGKSFVDTAKEIYQRCTQCGDKKPNAIKKSWCATYKVFRGCTNTDNSHNYCFDSSSDYTGFMIARNIAYPEFLDFSSLSLFELSQLDAADVKLRPNYRYHNIAEQLLEDILETE